MIISRIHKNESARGSVLAILVLCVAGLAALSAAMVTVSLSRNREEGAELRKSQAGYSCQAGLSQALYKLQRGESGAIGSAEVPATWGDARFWVKSASGGTDIVVLDATGLDNRTGVSQQLVLGAVRANMWTRALFGKDGVALASNVIVDSYDSSLGTYDSQLSGAGALAHANSNGSVGSNGDISASANVKIWGDLTPGPGHTVTLSGGTVSGSTDPASAPETLPPITVPTYTSFGALTVNANQTIPAGDRTYTNIKVRSNNTLTFTGPANIVISNLELLANSSVQIDDTDGPVTLTVIDNFVINSNCEIYPRSKNPANLRISLLSDNVADPGVIVALDSVKVSSNSTIYGIVYAPEARVVLDSNFQLYGALMARSLTVDSNVKFHYDEHLQESMSSGLPSYQKIAWRVMPYQD